jgi:WD repeat-containing protein 19
VTAKHLKAARNLLRVANNITMFDKDAPKILTTVVVECSECQLNKSASEWALVLMGENYKSGVPESYKSKISAISRKAYKQEEEDVQSTSPCPFCNTEVPEYTLDCYNCHNVIPFCIATGKHMTAKDCTKCTHCHFPAILPELTTLLMNDRVCPMCEGNLDPQLLDKIDDSVIYLKSRKTASLEMAEKEKQKEENAKLNN